MSRGGGRILWDDQTPLNVNVLELTVGLAFLLLWTPLFTWWVRSTIKMLQMLARCVQVHHPVRAEEVLDSVPPTNSSADCGWILNIHTATYHNIWKSCEMLFWICVDYKGDLAVLIYLGVNTLGCHGSSSHESVCQISIKLLTCIPLRLHC